MSLKTGIISYNNNFKCNVEINEFLLIQLYFIRPDYKFMC